MEFKPAQVPLVKIVLALLGGVFFFDQFKISLSFLSGAAVLLFIGSVAMYFFSRNLPAQLLTSALFYLLIFTCGGLLISDQKLSENSAHYSYFDYPVARGLVTAAPEEKNKSYRSLIDIQYLRDSSGRWMAANGTLLVYLQKDSFCNKLEIGDEVLFSLRNQAVEGPKNPGQFDYRSFLARKSIFRQQYLKKGELLILHKHKGLALRRVSNAIAISAQAILEKYIPVKEHFSLADGILLGRRAAIDPELYNAFAYTGILHILSVSGLHVGIIYGMLLFLLGFIRDESRKVKIAKFLFSFLFIWLFAFVTGLSAACVRAAILFSLLNYGRIAKEHISNLNLLAGSALLQVLPDPGLAFDLGFQLSYLAMLGLFIFYKPIYALFYHPNKLIDWTWKLWSASIAAQLFTVPLSIYYFGNFPTYFLFANIFAIPLSTLILWLSMLILPLSLLPFAAHLIGSLDSMVIALFIRLTRFIAGLPLGKLHNAYLQKEQLYLLIVSIILLAIYTFRKRAYWLIGTLLLFLCCIGIAYAYNISQLRKERIVFYSIPGKLAIGIQTNERQTLLVRDSLNEQEFNYSVSGSYRIWRIHEHQQLFLRDSIDQNAIFYKKDLLFVHGKSFYFLDRSNSRQQFGTPLNVDFVVISGNCYLDVAALKTNFGGARLILSADNDRKHLRIYQKLLDKERMKYEDISAEALIL